MSTIVTITMNPTIDLSVSTPKVEPVHKLRCSAVRRDPGGGGINVARVIKRLGGDCAALYPAGGLFGQVLQRLVEAEAIESLAIEISAETRESFTATDESSGEQYRFVLPGPELKTEDWQACLNVLAALSPQPAYVVVSGSLPPGAPDEFMTRVARLVRTSGGRLVVDTSGAALAAALAEGVYLVKPNLRELKELTGRALVQERDWVGAATEIVESGGAEVVALTLGSEGALMVSRELQTRASGIPVNIVSAVGAGDSFLAAMVWRLATENNLIDAFRYGVAAGTAALLTPGTELCRKSDTERLQKEIHLRDLANNRGWR
jgi:6-phosphofructokinase 2